MLDPSPVDFVVTRITNSLICRNRQVQRFSQAGCPVILHQCVDREALPIENLKGFSYSKFGVRLPVESTTLSIEHFSRKITKSMSGCRQVIVFRRAVSEPVRKRKDPENP